MSKLARPLVVLLALLFTTFAQAGHYIGQFSGGSAIYFFANGSSMVLPYGNWNGGYGGEGGICTGKITSTFTWVSDSPTDIPPSAQHPIRVVTNQRCGVSAAAVYPNNLPYGSGYNGLGETMGAGDSIDNAGGYNPFDGSDGGFVNHFQEYTDTTGTIVLECTPYAEGVDDGFGPSTVYIEYRADLKIALEAHVTVTVSSASDPTSKVAGLTYNNAANKQRQEGVFNVSAAVTTTNGQSFSSAAKISYQWSAASQGGGLEFANRTAQSTTAIALAPSRCLPTCMVVVDDKGKTYTWTDSRPCAAIGGPITIAIRKGVEKGQRPYEHDLNDPTKAFYMTFFKYSHDTVHHGPIPFLAQGTQGVTLSVEDQPPGTTVTWTKPLLTYTADPLTQIYTTSAPRSLPVRLDAEEAFRDEIPIAHFDYVDPAVPTMTGNTNDDSSQSKKPGKSSGTYVDIVNRISAHKPGKLIGSLGPPIVDDPTPTRTYRTPPTGASAWTEQTEYVYLLVDSFGEPMPGVRVQERFITPLPAGFLANDDRHFWNTFRGSSERSPGIDSRDGKFNGTDRLWFVWSVVNPTLFEPIHVYYAGTEDSDPNATSGIELGSYKIQFVPGRPSSSDIPALKPGDPGSARQSKQP